jgi:hypothetical protein
MAGQMDAAAAAAAAQAMSMATTELDYRVELLNRCQSQQPRIRWRSCGCSC